MDYPVFVWWYLGDPYKKMSDRLEKNCKELGIEYVVERLPIKKYKKEMRHVKDHLSERRYKIKCGLLWLRDIVIRLDQPVFFLHADYRIIIKPEIGIFNNKEIGYSIAKTNNGQEIIASAGLYFNGGELSNNFLDILTYKCINMPTEIPTEHGLIRTTIFEFSGCLYDEKMLPIQNTCWEKSLNKFTCKEKILPLKGKKKKYIISKIKNNTYIHWS